MAGTFYLQLGAFSQAARAAELREALMRSGALIGAIAIAAVLVINGEAGTL